VVEVVVGGGWPTVVVVVVTTVVVVVVGGGRAGGVTVQQKPLGLENPLSPPVMYEYSAPVRVSDNGDSTHEAGKETLY
jgi:hypothetical protein